MSRMRRRAAGDSGAAAVEFALVLPILVLILFGIIDYGLFFSNTLSAQSGVQTAARQAVVGNFDTGCTPLPPPGPSQNVRELMCMVKNNTGSITGDSFVKVVFPPDPNDPTHVGWFQDHQLIVCEVIDVNKGLTGYVPLPRHNGEVAIRSRVVTQIETSVPPSADVDAAEGDPPGGWGWCT